MPVLTRDDLRNQLKRREIAPVYVLFGDERYLRDVAARTIGELAFAEGDFRDFNETRFDLSNDADVQSALAAARQMPMMSSRRVVRITGVRISSTGHRDTITENDEPLLSAYLDDPPPQSVVVFVADDLNGVRKMGKLLRERTRAVEFKPLDDRELLKWAETRSKDNQVEIDASTLRLIVERVGASVSRLSNEIDKLAAAALPGNVIGPDLVDSLVPNSRELLNFALTDNLVAGRRVETLAAMRKILGDGVEPLALLGLISYNLRRMLMVKDLMEKGVDRREVASVAKLRYNEQEPFLAAARRASLARLKYGLKRLAETDVAIKTSVGGSGPAGARMQLEMLVCELAFS